MRRYTLHRLDHPLYLFVAIILLHVCGRVGAFCSKARVDSVLYAYSSYFFYQPDASMDMVVAEKPMGLYAVVGLSYLLMPGPPSRLTIVPIESIFMLGGYFWFWLLARRLHGPRTAWLLSLAAVISVNLLNVFDTGTDGFNLAENYLWLPMLLALYAMLYVDHPLRSGLVAGLGVGLACSFKQTALTLAIVVAGALLLKARDKNERHQARTQLLWIAVGIAGIWGPLVIYLVARGWLVEHVCLMLSLPGRRAAWPQLTWPDHYELLPFLWAAWWLVLAGLLRWPFMSWRRTSGSLRQTDTAKAALLLWLGLETAILAVLKIPSSHYFQIVVLPLLLLGGYALNDVRAMLQQSSYGLRYRMALPLAVTSMCILVYAALPLVAAAKVRGRFFDSAREARDFGRTISKVSGRSAGATSKMELNLFPTWGATGGLPASALHRQLNAHWRASRQWHPRLVYLSGESTNADQAP